MKWQTTLGIFLSLIISTAEAKESGITPAPDTFGIGAMVGTIGAINGKYWFDAHEAADVGVEFMDRAWQVFYADYYYHFPALFGNKTRFGRETAPYIAVGTGGGFWSRKEHCGRWKCKWNPGSTGTGNGFFARIIVGSEWFPKRSSFSAYAEVGPSYIWYPSNGNTIDAAVGGRYYF